MLYCNSCDGLCQVLFAICLLEKHILDLPPTPQGAKVGISTGVIIGLVIGAVTVLGGGSALCLFLMKKKNA